MDGCFFLNISEGVCKCEHLKFLKGFWGAVFTNRPNESKAMKMCDVCHSSGAVRRHDGPEHVGAAHRALLPETRQQVQERRLKLTRRSCVPSSRTAVPDLLHFSALFSRGTRCVCQKTQVTGSCCGPSLF